jgi:hypothetical protein
MLVLHRAKQIKRVLLPPFSVLKETAVDDRLRLLNTGVQDALQIDSVPQLRLDSDKNAAVWTLLSLALCLHTEEGLESAGFDESGELHLYVDKDSSAAGSSRQQAAAGNIAHGHWH